MKTNKNSEITLNTSIDDLKNTIEEIVNGNAIYLSVMSNLFKFKNIETCLRPKEYNYWFNHRSISFQFSYNDIINNLITVKYNFSNNSMYEFLKETDYINFEQLQMINTKVMRMFKQINNNMTNDEAEKRINDMLYSEALIIITDAINKDDVEAVKSEFESRHEKWLECKNEINEQGVMLINDLYNNILKIKLSEKD